MKTMFSRRTILKGASLLAAAAMVPTAAFAKTIKRFSQSRAGFALKGYDTTAYFSSGSPAKGIDATTISWKGAKWRFATEEEATLFKANPDAYAPQFGGYCTRAMSLKKEAPGDPEVWRMHGDKLYVFFAKRGGTAFDKGPDEMIVLAQAYWDTLDFTE